MAIVLAPALIVLGGTLQADRAAPGDVVWVARGDLPSIPISLHVSPSGDTVFATDEMFDVVAYDALTGALRWRGNWKRGYVSSAWALSPDGSAIYATGQGSLEERTYATVAFDLTTGQRLWVSRSFDGRGGRQANSVGVSPDGGTVFVTGSINNKRYATVAYRASTGQQLWVSSMWNRRFGASAYFLAVDPGGKRLFVTGLVGSPAHIVTVAYDTLNGEALWRHRYERRPGSSEWVRGIAVDDFGSFVFVTGSTTSTRNGNESRYVTIAYDALTGDPRWTRLYNGSPEFGDIPADLVVDSKAARMFVTGYSNEDIATVAYDATSGATLWATRYDVEGPFGEPEDMSIDPDVGRLYVLGTVWGAGPDEWDDFAVVAYETATGAQSWFVRWGGAGELREQASAVALDPGGGRVYVTGSSADGKGSYDHVVIAFATSG